MFAGLVTEARLQALALQLADLRVVEGDVVVRRAAEREPVVVDGLHALLLGLLLDGRTRGRVQVDDRQDGDAAGDHLLGDGLHLLRVVLRVLDVVVDAGLLEGRLELRPVLGLPARRGRGVREDHADLALDGGAAAAARAAAAATAVLLPPLLPPHAATVTRRVAEMAVVVRMRRRAMEVLPFRRGYREIPFGSLRDKWCDSTRWCALRCRSVTRTCPDRCPGWPSEPVTGG